MMYRFLVEMGRITKTEFKEITGIVGFEDIVYSQDVLDRFEEIKNLDLADSLANDYVLILDEHAVERRALHLAGKTP